MRIGEDFPYTWGMTLPGFEDEYRGPGGSRRVPGDDSAVRADQDQGVKYAKVRARDGRFQAILPARDEMMPADRNDAENRMRADYGKALRDLPMMAAIKKALRVGDLDPATGVCHGKPDGMNPDDWAYLTRDDVLADVALRWLKDPIIAGYADDSYRLGTRMLKTRVTRAADEIHAIMTNPVVPEQTRIKAAKATIELAGSAEQAEQIGGLKDAIRTVLRQVLSTRPEPIQITAEAEILDARDGGTDGQ